MEHESNVVNKVKIPQGLAGGAADVERIEGALEEKQLYLATILATVPVGILVIDAETHTIVDANPKAVEMIGSPREAIIGSVCHRFICPAETGACPITDQGQKLDNAERTLMTAAGTPLPIIKTVASVTLHGRPHLVESFLDMSDRKRAEQTLQESEERYRDILDNANDLIQSVAPDGSFLYVNRAWKETLGYTDEEVADLKVFDIISPECRSHCLATFQKVMEGEKVQGVEARFLAKDGRVVELEGSANCNFADGTPVATRSIFRDVTERKRIERELLESEERYRQLFEHAPDAIFVHSEGTFRYANREAFRLFGVERVEQIIGQPVLSFVSPDYREIIGDRIRQLEKTPGSAVPTMEMEVVRLDGTVIDVESTGASIPFQGKPAVQVILRDITERKQAEREREEWNRTLEQKVEEKTRHLKEAQAKLIQAEKMATLSEVVSGASHELNNPLAGILGAIQMLRKSSLVKPIEPGLMNEIDVLEGMESAALRCQRIIEDLIRFSTQSRCNFSQVDVNQVLRDILEAMGDTQHTIEVTWHANPAIPSIEGDFVKLFEVFANILQNAKSAMPDGGAIEIVTRTATGDDGTPQVIVSINDTGCGIPAENLSKIFDPFFTTKPAGKGPGLGLTVSYGIIKRHHGDIEVRSTLGEGTQVDVTLPVKQPGS
jgi:PAS domain S-box-containing protein